MPNLFGEVSLQLDKRGRLLCPSNFQADFAAGAVLTRGIDQCLLVFPLNEWQNLTKKLSGLPLLNPLARDFCRLMYSGTNVTRLDRSGHLAITPHLREYAGLAREVVIVGLGGHLEIWSAEVWREQRHEFELSSLGDAAHWMALPL